MQNDHEVISHVLLLQSEHQALPLAVVWLRPNSAHAAYDLASSPSAAQHALAPNKEQQHECLRSTVDELLPLGPACHPAIPAHPIEKAVLLQRLPAKVPPILDYPDGSNSSDDCDIVDIIGDDTFEPSAFSFLDQIQSLSTCLLPSRDDDEADALRLRLSDIATSTAALKEQNERIKRMLVTEQNESGLEVKKRHDHALAHEAERCELQEALRKADAARRELDSQIILLKQRMQDMNEDYSRGLEKEYLRQEYIHELRTHFEDEIRELEQQLIAQQNARRYDRVARNQVEHLLAKVVTEIEKWQQVDQER